MGGNYDNNKEKFKYSSEIPTGHTGLENQTKLQTYFPLPSPPPSPRGPHRWVWISR